MPWSSSPRPRPGCTPRRTGRRWPVGRRPVRGAHPGPPRCRACRVGAGAAGPAVVGKRGKRVGVGKVGVGWGSAGSGSGGPDSWHIKQGASSAMETRVSEAGLPQRALDNGQALFMPQQHARLRLQGRGLTLPPPQTPPLPACLIHVRCRLDLLNHHQRDFVGLTAAAFQGRLLGRQGGRRQLGSS